MKKVVLKLDLHDNHAKRKVMKAVSTLPRIDSLAVDMKDGKLTVIGDVDPVDVVGKLRKKQMHAEILTVGPAKEEKPKDGGGDPNKGKADPKKDPIAQILEAYTKNYYPPYLNNCYLHHYVSADEDPNSCVIF